MRSNETTEVCERVLLRGNIHLAVQPIRRILEHSRISGPWVEVLVRPWGVSAACLVDHCASTGRATELDLLVFERGLGWLADNPEIALCSFNLSGLTLAHPHIDRRLLEILDGFAVSPSRICLEVTETAPISDYAHARALLSHLRQRGARVALDDFGCGSSHMRLLTPLQVDFIKIEGDYVRGLPLGGNRRLIRGVVALAQELGLETVAEAVETSAQAEELREAGVNYMQGFHDDGQPIQTGIDVT